MTIGRWAPSSPWLRAAAGGALSGLLFASSVWLPPLGLLLCLCSPLPLGLAAWSGGWRAAAAAGAAGAALAVALTGPVGAGVYLGQFALGGAVLGSMLRAERSPHASVGAFAGLLVAGFWFVLGALALQAGKNPVDFVAEAVRQSADQARELLARGGDQAENAAELRRWADQTAASMLRVFPGLLVSFGLLAGWANALGLRRLLRGRGEDLSAWNTWRAPESWIWALIGSGLLAALAPGMAGTAGLNVFVPAVAVYFLQGLAVIDHLFQARGFPRPLRALTYTLLFVQPPIALAVAAVGAFDLWADFRARWSPPPTKSIET